jgi:hypothetical protein
VTTAALRAPVVPRPRRSAPERVDLSPRQRRRLRWSATLAGVRARAALASAGSVRRRQSVQVCGAARLLTAAGVRVVVVQPPAPWPRTRAVRLAARNEAGLLGDLALLTAVPRTTTGWAAVADRVLPVGTPIVTDDRAAAVLCPVTVSFRTADGPLPATGGLVVEVRLLAARPVAGD